MFIETSSLSLGWPPTNTPAAASECWDFTDSVLHRTLLRTIVFDTGYCFCLLYYITLVPFVLMSKNQKSLLDSPFFSSDPYAGTTLPLLLKL